MTDEQLEVDISADEPTDEPAPTDEIDEAEAERGRELEKSDKHVDLEEQAKEEAVRLRENSDGQTQAERTRNAIDQAKQSIRDCAEQLQSVSQDRTQTENHIERLEKTKDRVESQPEGTQILQTLAGGVSLEVPPDDYPAPSEEEAEDHDPYTRSDLCEEIDETIERLEEKLESLDETERKLTQSMEKTKMAGKRLEEFLEMLEADDRSVGGAEPVKQPYSGEMPR